jgi:hypothetical protein
MTSTWETKPKVFCAEIGCPPIPGKAAFDHQPGCYWYGVVLVDVTPPKSEVCPECGQPDNCGDCDHTPALCGWCGNSIGDFFDEYGSFTIFPEGDDGRTCCEACYHGPLGDKHRQRYGVGDR